MYPIENSIEIAAPVATLRGAITTRDGFRGWLADDTKVGAALVVDGPYAEGREAVLGFVAVRVADLDEACRIADESPFTALGGVTEVRIGGAFPGPAQSR